MHFLPWSLRTLVDGWVTPVVFTLNIAFLLDNLIKSYTSAQGRIGKITGYDGIFLCLLPPAHTEPVKSKVGVVVIICFFTPDHWLLTGTQKKLCGVAG